MMPLLHRRPGRALVLTMLVLSLAALAAGWWLLLSDLPPVRSLEQHVVRPTTQILDRNGRLLYEVMDPNAGKQISLALDDLPKACIDATIATEDARFYRHPGVDVVAIGRAFYQNLRADGQIVSGGSTLTQQLARMLLLDADERYEQSLRRKLREAYLALAIEMRYSKDQVLALYLNQSYYGSFAYGIEAAAQVYFSKPARHLARGECALLAGLVQYPGGYNPLDDPEAAKARQLTVLRLMRDAGRIDEAERSQIAAEPLRYKSHLFAIEAPHFVMYVQDLLTQQLGRDALRRGGLTVRTTLDLDLQHRAEEAVRYRLDLLNCRVGGLCTDMTDPNRRVDNAAVVVLDSRSGDVLAMVGSPDYFDASIQGNVNAALSLRQPGSAIKPLTYAAALDPEWAAHSGVDPITPGTILADLPAVFYVDAGTATDANAGGAGDSATQGIPYVPVNYDRTAHGPVSVREALANSFNVPAVRVLDRIGVTALQRIAAQAGITTFTGDFGLALTLGGGEVRLLELAAAYGLLDDGRRLEPRSILSIDRLEAQRSEDLEGGGEGGTSQNAESSTLSGSPASNPQVISPQAAWLLTDILDDDVARLPAFGGNSVLHLPFPAAAKTGTTTDWRDNWTLGYTTERVVGVWVGNADNTPMRDVSGIDGAGPIWRDVMLAAHRKSPGPFARPSGIVDVSVCAPSGMLATPLCPRTRIEHYISGTEPAMPDTQFVAVEVDRATGLRATARTPIDRILRRVYWRLPAQYHDWMVAQGIPLIPGDTGLVDARIAEPTIPGDLASLAADQSNRPLLLAAPTANTAYRIYPGQPRDAQRIEIAGYVPDGSTWAALRLVAQGPEGMFVLVEANAASRVRGWWELQPGTWQFRLEGQRTAGAGWEVTPTARVDVQEFDQTVSLPEAVPLP